MKILAVLDCINSEIDINGNQYWAFCWTDTETGKRVRGRISGGESNISCIIQEMVQNSQSVLVIRHEMKKRAFKHLTKEWLYAGCHPKDLAAFVKRELQIKESLVLATAWQL